MPVLRPIPPEWLRNPSDHAANAAGYGFDPEAGVLVCDFIESLCRQSKGKWAGQPITLLPWQRDLIMRLFGWVRPEPDDHLRRFRRCYVEVAKKNGKSTLVSALTLYMLLADGEGAPEVYLNACDKKQAAIVFEEAARMVDSSPELSSRLEVKRGDKRIIDPVGYGAIITNSADAPNKDGLNPSLVVFDELHRQPDSSLWDVFEYAGASREQPLTVSITTAGESEEGVWFEQRDYAEKVNAGVIDDPTFLGVVYRADPADDIHDPATWRKANPSLGATLSEDDFARELTEAGETPRKLPGFKRLRLNIVSRADSLFIEPDDWSACGPPGGKPARPDRLKLRGLACYVGGDLSRTTDLTAVVALWGDAESGYDLDALFWMPEDAVLPLSKRDRVPYQAWVDQGWITATPGSVVDYEFVRRDVNDLAADHDVRRVLFDPYNATQLLTELRESDGLPVEEIRQGFLSLSGPTKELERLVKARKVRHGNNPVLRWMAGNAIAEEDAAGNVKLSKKKSRQKIDGMAALVNAVAAATAGGDGGESVYSSRGLLVI